MALTTDILASYRSPRRVMRRKLAAGAGEDVALFYLLVACALIFVAQWPVLSRQAFEDPSVPLSARLGGALMAWLFIAPLLMYLLAALSHLLARAFGGAGRYVDARLALFWALLAAAPLWLLNGLVAGFIGPGPELTIVGAIALAGFGTIWLLSLIEAERPGATA